MKTRQGKKKCAEWPFGPRSGQESPTLGANSTKRRPICSTPAGRRASTFAGTSIAHCRPNCQSSVKGIGDNVLGVKHFRADAANNSTSGELQEANDL